MLLILWLLFHFLIKETKQIVKNGVYNIIVNKEEYLNYQDKNIKISYCKKFENKSNFRIKQISLNSFFIQHIETNLTLTLSSSNLELTKEMSNKAEWNFIESDEKYCIQNIKKCYIRYRNQKLFCDNISLKDATQFNLIKIYEEVNNSKNDINLIEREPIDVLIKYCISLSYYSILIFYKILLIYFPCVIYSGRKYLNISNFDEGIQSSNAIINSNY
jgi:hypothetical protein